MPRVVSMPTVADVEPSDDGVDGAAHHAPAGAPTVDVVSPAAAAVVAEAAEVIEAAEVGSVRAASTSSSSSPATWRQRYRALIISIDFCAAVLGGVIGYTQRFGSDLAALSGARVVTIVALPFAWLACTSITRAYESRFLGAGTMEYERIGRAFLYLVAVTTFAAYFSNSDLSRGFVMVALPVTLLLSTAGRYAVRKTLHHRRRSGRAVVPVLAVGNPKDIVSFATTLQRNDYTGLRLAGACVTADDDDDAAALLAEHGIARVGDIDTVRSAVSHTSAQTVALVSQDISGEKARWVSWQLEGTPTDLVLMPGLAEVAGRRLDIHQVGGLPLVYVAQPDFKGIRRLCKAGFDRAAAAFGILALAPLLLTVAALVRLTSRGPAFFTQTRVGKDGKAFRMVKFRSMCADAESMVSSLQNENEFEGGTMFKMRDDPRITRVGKILRRYSLDELPQLFNVLSGSMSLVGPRPPLPTEVATYLGETKRRLLVKPGLTGLWQISGRSDLSWEESVRLDLRYVESWSLTLDMIVLLKTFGAVLRSDGAY